MIAPCQRCGWRHEPTQTETVQVIQDPDVFSSRPGNRRPFSSSWRVEVDGHTFKGSGKSWALDIARKYAAGRKIEVQPR